VADFKKYLVNAGYLVLVAVRSFVLTMLLMLLVGTALAAATYYLLADHFWYALMGAAIVLLEAAMVGVIWASKRAMIVTMVHGLRRHRVGAKAVRLVFQRVLGVSPEPAFGDRGGFVTRTIERLPLAQAEQRLTETVDNLIHAPEEDRRLRSRVRLRIQARLLRYVQALTLARFRDACAQEGGVDMFMVQAELEERLDEMLANKLSGGLWIWTICVLLGLPAQVLATAYIVLACLK
jgi:hypothetical protein